MIASRILEETWCLAAAEPVVSATSGAVGTGEGGNDHSPLGIGVSSMQHSREGESKGGEVVVATIVALGVRALQVVLVRAQEVCQGRCRESLS